MRVYIGMKGGMDKYLIMPGMGDKELPRVGSSTGLLQSPQFLCSNVLSACPEGANNPVLPNNH